MSRARRFIPPQHGAWAMLLLPWLAGTIVAGFRWLHVPLLLAWLTGYLASYYGLLAVKTRRPGKVRTQLVVYTVPTVLLGGLIVVLRPEVLWYAPLYAVLLAVSVAYAARRNDRALLNDLALVAQSCLMVFVCATVAGVPPGRVVAAFAIVTAYLVGTILHVKAMIRERGDIRFRRASVAYHLVILTGAVWLDWISTASSHGPGRGAATVVFGFLAVRAWLLPRRRLSPARIGIVEIVASVLVLLAVIVTA